VHIADFFAGGADGAYLRFAENLRCAEFAQGGA
jgi:hypothetical protein